MVCSLRDFYSSKTNRNVSWVTAIASRRKARSSLNSGITSIIWLRLMILTVARTDGMTTGTQIGKRRNDRRRVFPSENITSPEMKDPAIARSTIPSMKMRRKVVISRGGCRLKKAKESGITTASTRRRMTVEERVFPKSTDAGEQGNVFNPPNVPRSISLVKEVEKVRILAKKSMIHKAAEVTSGLVVMAPPQAKLQMRRELTEKVRIDRISWGRLNSTFRSFRAIAKADERKPTGIP